MLHRFAEETGFTLIEILVTILIIGVLTAIVVFSLMPFKGRGEQAAYDGDRRNLQVAVDAYYTDLRLTVLQDGVPYSSYPTDLNGGLLTGPGHLAILNVSVLRSQGYIRELPITAASANYAGADGAYVWVIDSKDGSVYGCPIASVTIVGHEVTGVANPSVTCVR